MSRTQILGAVRRGLKRGPLPAQQAAALADRLDRPKRNLVPSRAKVPRQAQIALFVTNVEKEFGTVHRVTDAAAVPQAIAAYLAGHNLPARCVVAPHPELLGLPWSSAPLLQVAARRAAPEDSVGVQHGFAGIAETGTLMLPSAPTRPTTLNLLPDTAVVVLRSCRLLATPEDAWDLWRQEHGGAMPRNVMLVTGPSRSADIEQTLELGAHGPRRLHVVLVDDEAAAMPGG